MSREAAQTARRLDCCELENQWRVVSFVVRKGLALETTPNVATFVTFMFFHIYFVLALVLLMPRLKPSIVAHYDFKSCTNNQTPREVAQRTKRLESKGCNIMLVPSIVSSSESSKHCRCMKSRFVH